MALSLVSRSRANILSLREEDLQSMSTDELDMIIAKLDGIKNEVSDKNTSNSDKEAVKSDESNCSEVAIKDDSSNCNKVAVKGEISSYGKVAICTELLSYPEDITESLILSIESIISGLSLVKIFKCNNIEDSNNCKHALTIIQNTAILFEKIKESVLSNKEALSYANEIVESKGNIFTNIKDFLKSHCGKKNFMIAAVICFSAIVLMLPGLYVISDLGLKNVIHFLKKFKK